MEGSGEREATREGRRTGVRGRREGRKKWIKRESRGKRMTYWGEMKLQSRFCLNKTKG